jgi:hypothetical protein
VTLGLGILGCDQGPSTKANDAGQPPVLSCLSGPPVGACLGGIPDTLRAPPGDTITVNISVNAQDPDGRLDRVVAIVEPTSLDGPVRAGALFNFGRGEYRGAFTVPLPTTEELYAVRAYAVDDDGLASNRVLGQFRFLPTP